MSASLDLAEALPTLNSMASSFNVYPLILKYVKNRRAEIGSPRLLAYVIALFVVHGILLIQATLTLVLKITHRSKYGKLWFWRKQYLLDQTIPYLIPNGQFIIEPLQILGCIFFELLTVVIYIGVRWPDTVLKRPAYHETSLFWVAVAFVPGFMGFWWSGWSAFYALFLTPTHASHSNHGRIARMYQSPILMNTLCIGLPVLISLFFITLGVSLSTSHAKLEETYSTLIKQLLHLSEIWKPNDPNTVDNNQHLFDALQRIITGAKKTLHTLQITAIGWAITSMIIIAFYVVNAISVGKVTRRTLRMATGKATLLTYTAKDTKSLSQLRTSGCDDELESKAESNHPQVSQPSQPSVMMKSVSSLSLQRTLYLLRASCGLMVISLGFNFCISIIIVVKAHLFLKETYWQITLASNGVIACIVVSFSLFLQSLIHIQHQ